MSRIKRQRHLLGQHQISTWPETNARIEACINDDAIFLFWKTGWADGNMNDTPAASVWLVTI